jgi:hypothetical protein
MSPARLARLDEVMQRRYDAMPTAAICCSVPEIGGRLTRFPDAWHVIGPTGLEQQYGGVACLSQAAPPPNRTMPIRRR